MSEIRQKFIEINKRIFNHKDGEILQMQKEYGAVYKKSLGVSIVSLERIAAFYEPSHELAKMLWEFGGREQILIASMLEEPSKVEQEELEALLRKLETPELWEQVARNLLRKIPQIDVFINSWLSQRESKELHICAVLSLGFLPNLFSEIVLQQISELDCQEGSYLSKTISRVLLKMGVRDRQAFSKMQENKIMQVKYEDLLKEIASFY